MYIADSGNIAAAGAAAGVMSPAPLLPPAAAAAAAVVPAGMRLMHANICTSCLYRPDLNACIAAYAGLSSWQTCYRPLPLLLLLAVASHMPSHCGSFCHAGPT